MGKSDRLTMRECFEALLSHAAAGVVPGKTIILECRHTLWEAENARLRKMRNREKV